MLINIILALVGFYCFARITMAIWDRFSPGPTPPNPPPGNGSGIDNVSIVKKWLTWSGIFAVTVWIGSLCMTAGILCLFMETDLAVLIGFLVWSGYIRWSTHYFIVNLRAKYGLVVTNQLTGSVRELRGAGLHPVWPWDRVQDKHFFNFEEFPTEDRKETFPSTDSELIVKFSARLRRIPGQLVKQLGVDQALMKKAILDKMSSELREEIKKHASEAVVGDQVDLETILMAADGEISKLAIKYGLAIEPVIADIDFDEETQKARTLERVMAKTGDAAKKLQENLAQKDAAGNPIPGTSIDPDDALEAALVVGGHVKKTIDERGVRPGAKDEKVLEIMTRIGQALFGGRSDNDQNNDGNNNNRGRGRRR